MFNDKDCAFSNTKKVPDDTMKYFLGGTWIIMKGKTLIDRVDLVYIGYTCSQKTVWHLCSLRENVQLRHRIHILHGFQIVMV